MMPVTSMAPSPFILPIVGRPVRLRAGDRSVLADVHAAAPERIELGPREPLPAGTAELMYSTPRGVVVLAGELSLGDAAVFVPREQQRADQRREAFRVPVHVEGSLRRRDGAAFPVTVVELSATGGLVRGAVGIEAEERVVLALQFGDDPVELPAIVGRREADAQFAVRFEAPPRAALGALERFVAAEQRRLL
jgi:hypothetical protein